MAIELSFCKSHGVILLHHLESHQFQLDPVLKLRKLSLLGSARRQKELIGEPAPQQHLCYRSDPLRNPRLIAVILNWNLLYLMRLTLDSWLWNSCFMSQPERQPGKPRSASGQREALSGKAWCRFHSFAFAQAARETGKA
jgi:hypothetical protein